MNIRVSAALALALTASACSNSVERHESDGVTVTAVRVNFNNSYVVERDGRSILIDSGLERDAGTLRDRLVEAGVDVDALAASVLTHGHADHAGGARFLRAEHGIPIVVGAGDDEIIAAGGEAVLCPTDDMARGRVEQDGGERFAPFDADILVAGGPTPDTLTGSTGLDGELVFVPSHTDGSLAVVVGPFAFIGDLFRGDIFTATATVHFYMCDLDANRADIEGLLDNHPDVTTFFAGHFGPVSRAEVEALLIELLEGG